MNANKILRSTDIGGALRSKQRGFLMNPFRMAPQTGGDPYWANVDMLVHADGANLSTIFTDTSSSPKTLTAAGAVTVSTAQSKFGGSSIRIAALSQYVDRTEALDLTTGSYTLESWIFIPANVIGDGNTILTGGGNIYPNRWLFDAYMTASTTLNVRLITASNAINHTKTAAASLNTWNHVAVVNNVETNVITTFINGVSAGTRAAFQLSNQTISIGRNSSGWTESPYFLDDIRITKGIARYTANFTPPTAPFPDF